MSNEKLSNLPVANPTADADLLYTVQGGTSKKTTALNIKNYIGASSGNFKIVGGWDASTNTPALASGVGTAWDAYVVTVGGNTDLDGVKSWFVDDVLVFDGVSNAWKRMTNLKYMYPLTISGYFDATNGDAFDNGGQPVGTLVSGVGIPWHAYGASNVGNYNLDGETDWKPGDLAIFNGITNLWQKSLVTYINGKSGNISFPAAQGGLMFGSADNFIDQDGNLFWDKSPRNFKAGFNNNIDSTATNCAITGGSGNLISATASDCNIAGGNSNQITGTTTLASINGGNSNLIQDSSSAYIDSCAITQITSNSAFSKASSSLGVNIFNSPNSSVENSLGATISNSQNCKIESSVNGPNINNCAFSKLSESDACTVEQLNRSLVTSGDNSAVSQSDGSFIVLNHKNNYTNITYSMVSGGDASTIANITTSSVLPGVSNTFDTLTNCLVGSGNSNAFKNATASIDIGGSGNGSDLAGNSSHIRIGGTNNNNSSTKFISINSDNIINTGEFCTYIGTLGINNSGGLSNVACFGYNSGSYSPPFPNQASFFWDNGISINRYGFIGDIVTNNITQNAVITPFPLSTYMCTPQDKLIIGKNTNGAASLTFVLPIESNRADGYETWLFNQGNMGASAVAQSGTGKLINGAGTYNIHASNTAWRFIWFSSTNQWSAFAYSVV